MVFNKIAGGRRMGNKSYHFKSSFLGIFLVFLINFLFSYSSLATEIFYDDLFPLSKTVDLVLVDYIPMSEDEISKKHQSVAFAEYDLDDKAIIGYDSDLFSKLGSLSQFLILEHERAHHRLGHSLVSRFLKVNNRSDLNNRLNYRKEVDADCEAGFRLKELYPGVLQTEIAQAMRDIYLAMGGSAQSYPEWLGRRIGKVVTCFEGELLKRPEVLPLPQI